MDTMTAITLHQRPVHRLPLADVVELVEHVRSSASAQPASSARARSSSGRGLAGGQVADERTQPIRKVRLRRSGNMTLHRLPR